MIGELQRRWINGDDSVLMHLTRYYSDIVEPRWKSFKHMMERPIYWCLFGLCIFVLHNDWYNHFLDWQ